VSFELRLEKFSGPLHLLLELIERRELPITEISLAKVTDDYLQYLETGDVPSEELADFLVLAARLLLMKASVLLPAQAVEEEGTDPERLASQLALYRIFVDASKAIEERFVGASAAYARTRQTLASRSDFLPPPGLEPRAFFESFSALLKRLEPFLALKQTSMQRVVSIQEKIERIRVHLLERARLSFRDLLSEGASRSEVVASFLALLELVKQRAVKALQGKAFEEIVLKRVE